MQKKKIIIIGGGPAGMMAAIRAASFNTEVILIEKNSCLGKKLLLSGKGRCNLTNACDLMSFLKRFSKNSEFLRDAFKIFFNRELMDFFKKRGLNLKIERQLRVFPVTDDSRSILDVLEKELKRVSVKIIYNTQVSGIDIVDNKVHGLKLQGGKSFSCDSLILATGGISYSFTGSTGDGLKIAEALGHKMISLRPGLVSLESLQPYPGSLEGLSLKNIRFCIVCGRKKITTDIGELLFTARGVSGPLVLSLSGQIVDFLNAKKKVFIGIDLKPALDREKLDNRFVREFRLRPKRAIKNMLKDLLPLRLIALFLKITNINPDKKAAQIDASERKALVDLFKALRLDIVKSRPIKEAMITKGGVCLKDINPRSMESRKICGLYFAGEMIDVDADTGGFNLQAAFSTGYLAGESAAEN